MSRFTDTLTHKSTSLTIQTQSTAIDPAGQMISATPVAAGAAVVGSAVVAYAIEEAQDD